MLFGLGFHPPDFGVFLEGTVKAIMLGGFAALIPTVTAERIREKEDGLVVDEAFEAGLFDDDDDEYGYAGGYVCPTCDNTNEVSYGVKGICIPLFLSFSLLVVCSKRRRSSQYHNQLVKIRRAQAKKKRHVLLLCM